MAKDQVYHARSKHIDIRYHHIRDIIKSKILVLEYVNSAENIADVLTKNLTKEKHIKFVNNLEIF